jgi:hypothetical protein
MALQIGPRANAAAAAWRDGTPRHTWPGHMHRLSIILPAAVDIVANTQARIQTRNSKETSKFLKEIEDGKQSK